MNDNRNIYLLPDLSGVCILLPIDDGDDLVVVRGGLSAHYPDEY